MPYLVTMKVVLPNAEAADALTDHLERCGCVVKRVGARALDVSAAAGVDAYFAELELEAYIQVWRALNKGIDVEVVAPA
jgi:hypothetical protein